MSRHIYPTSLETVKVINGRAQRIAEEMEVTDKYIYAIQAGTETDPFAKFIALYAACVRAGCDVVPWITRIRLIDEKYKTLSKELHIGHVTANFVRESADVPAAHMEGKSLEKQLKEAQEAKYAAADLEQQLIRAINKRDDGQLLYNGKPYPVGRRQA